MVVLVVAVLEVVVAAMVVVGLFLMLGADALGSVIWSLRLKGELLVVFAVIGLPDTPLLISNRRWGESQNDEHSTYCMHACMHLKG